MPGISVDHGRVSPRPRASLPILRIFLLLLGAAVGTDPDSAWASDAPNAEEESAPAGAAGAGSAGGSSGKAGSHASRSESGGRRADIRDWMAAIEAMQSRHGRFHTIIGHSFGSMAARAAVTQGVAAGAVVAIGGMSSARHLVDTFASRVGIGPASADRLADRFARRILPHLDDAWTRFDGVATPLPERMPLLVVPIGSWLAGS